MNPIYVREARLAAAPSVSANQILVTAEQARRDAVELTASVRELDPREVWGQLALWAHDDLVRLCAVTVALAAMVPVDVPVSRLLAWTDHLEAA